MWQSPSFANINWFSLNRLKDISCVVATCVRHYSEMGEEIWVLVKTHYLYELQFGLTADSCEPFVFHVLFFIIKPP